MNWRFDHKLHKRAVLTAVVCGVVTLAGLAAADTDYTNGGARPYAGDGLVSWVDGEQWTDWADERDKREKSVRRYLYETDAVLSKQWGFRQDGRALNPYIGWKWFEEAPVGFGGVPFVVLKTVVDLDQENCKTADYDLCALAAIWRQPATIGTGLDVNERDNLDHLGFGPHPADYRGGAALAPGEREWPLPYGFVFQSGDPKYAGDAGPYAESVETLKDSTYEGDSWIEWWESKRLSWKADADDKMAYLRGILEVKRKASKTTLALAKFSERSLLGMTEERKADGQGHARFYEDDYAAFGRSTGLDRVFFSCAACHVGRVLVDEPGAGQKVVHLPGSPNTEVEAQYFSRLLMLTGAALVERGLDLESQELARVDEIEPNSDAVIGLYRAMIDKVLEAPGSFYGDSGQQRLRGYFMVWRAAWNFPRIVKDLIGTAVKTHYIYQAIGARYAFNAERQLAAGRISDVQQMPDVMQDRVGQMDAFGIASGLVAIHTLRPDQSFVRFIYDDVIVDGVSVFGDRPGDSPVFTGFPYANIALQRDLSGLDYEAQIRQASERVFANVEAWAPPVAAPVDIKSLNFSRDRVYANWDGNQGANARSLASGTSATGDPRKVNVQIHEPMNPFINHLPPMPYQWDVDLERARKGRQLFFDEAVVGGKKQYCSGCHQQNNARIYPAVAKLGVDEARSLTNTSVSRNMLAALVLEACTIYRNNHPDEPGNDFCMPEGETQQEKLDNYFADVPTRVVEATNGYKADMLHGIWARAPYLHNGSVPTLAAMICPDIRPDRFKRGNIGYDTALVGFEWAEKPDSRYNSKYETVLIKDYDTNQLSRSNTGHHYGSHLCPDLEGLDPVADRQAITRRILDSPVGDLLEYLKTL